MDVLREVAVDALHALFEMDVFEVHGLAELHVVGGERRALLVEQVTLAVALVDGAKGPAVGVEVCELR